MKPVDERIALARKQAFEDELCARMLSSAQSMRRDLHRQAWEANLTITDFLALRAMISRETAMHPSEIARVLGCSRANATKIGQRLVTADYVRERRDALRPRYKTFSVTDAGREAYARAKRNVDRTGRLEKLTEEQQHELYRLLGLVSVRLRGVCIGD